MFGQLISMYGKMNALILAKMGVLHIGLYLKKHPVTLSVIGGHVLIFVREALQFLLPFKVSTFESSASPENMR
jgi:hypothetical protein